MKGSYLHITFLFLIISYSTNAQIINTIAGGFDGDGLPPTSIGIVPQNQVADNAGNIFIADPERHIVRKLSASGVLSTIAGTGLSGYSGDGGMATSAQLKHPYNIAIDDAGNIFIADSYDSRIRKVAANGIITTIAGNGTLGFSGDGGIATAASLNGPNAIAVDKIGNIYVADFSNLRVRKIDANGIITTIAGNGTFGNPGEGVAAAGTKSGYPIGLAVNLAGELLISDYGFNKIRKLSVNGIVSTVAGDGSPGFFNDGGSAVFAKFNSIEGSVAVDAAGNIYIPDTRNNRIRKVSTNGIITTIAGNGGSGYSGDNNLATSAEIFYPTGVTVNSAGEIFISSYHRIRKVTPDGIILTISGNGSGGFSGDNIAATFAQIYQPNDVIVDASGNLYFSDRGDNQIRKIDVNGILSTIAGKGIAGFSGDGSPATLGELNHQTRLAMDKSGILYVSDFGNSRIRKITANGLISTVAGNGIPGFSGDGGPAIDAQLSSPDGVAVNGLGEVFIADRNNQRIRKIGLDGIINTIAGNGTVGFSGDNGDARLAQFNFPINVTLDSKGNIFVVDIINHVVRKIDAAGIITTVCGNGNSYFSGDGGPAVMAGITPNSVTPDSSGNLFITDGGRIRKVSAAGIITTVAGGGSNYGEGGLALAAELPGMTSVALDVVGNIFLTDEVNHRIRKISGSVLPLTLLSFHATQVNESVLTSWETVNEVNTKSFSVQRSANGISFKTIEIIKAEGNSANINHYNYLDANAGNLNANTLYYRLEIIDRDNKKSFSSIIRIVFASDDSFVFRLSPNPANGIVYVNGENIRQVIITDLGGKNFITQLMSSNTTSINIDRLSKGIYFVKAYFRNGNTYSRKLIVQ